MTDELAEKVAESRGKIGKESRVGEIDD
jgi:hypothetical protein